MTQWDPGLSEPYAVERIPDGIFTVMGIAGLWIKRIRERNLRAEIIGYRRDELQDRAGNSLIANALLWLIGQTEPHGRVLLYRRGILPPEIIIDPVGGDTRAIDPANGGQSRRPDFYVEPNRPSTNDPERMVYDRPYRYRTEGGLFVSTKVHG